MIHHPRRGGFAGKVASVAPRAAGPRWRRAATRPKAPPWPGRAVMHPAAASIAAVAALRPSSVPPAAATTAPIRRIYGSAWGRNRPRRFGEVRLCSATPDSPCCVAGCRCRIAFCCGGRRCVVAVGRSRRPSVLEPQRGTRAEWWPLAAR